jgi:hypothetical protein
MTVADRVRGEVDPVSEDDVVTHWLSEELEEEDDPGFAADGLTPAERLDELLERKPIADRVFEECDLDWYHARLEESELRGTRVVEGDDDEGWREVAGGDDTVESAAAAAHEAERTEDDPERADPEAVRETFEKDLDTVLGVAESVADGEDVPELVVAADEEPPFVIDGNHRAVGVVLATLRGEPYPDQPAFVGVPEEGRPADAERTKDAPEVADAVDED